MAADITGSRNILTNEDIAIPPSDKDTSQTDKTNASNLGKLQVIRRNGKITSFDGDKIAVAMTKAFLAVEGGNAAASSRIHETVAKATTQIVKTLKRRNPTGGTVHIEAIQDLVELELMRGEQQKVARAYVLYREEQARKRSKNQETDDKPGQKINICSKDGETKPIDKDRLHRLVSEACEGLEAVTVESILKDTYKNLYDGATEEDVSKALVMSARTMIEVDPDYSYAAARLLMDKLRREALGFLEIKADVATQADLGKIYKNYFKTYISKGVNLELLDSKLDQFDIERLGSVLDSNRDLKFTYLGLQTLYDRYFIHSDDIRFELPQAFFMRVAMGLAMNEINRDERAIEFYKLLSSFDFMSSTPTLFNSGTLRPQLSSCYLTTVPDKLDGIYGAIKDNALLSKYAGGLGNDWTSVRGMGSHIKGTNGKSQGVVPFLKVANDTAVAVNQGGKRKGAVCAYLETWHIDVEDFLELRKNTGDDRRRTHDMNTANWIPDLFMKRVAEDSDWTLFSPDDTPDLHDLTGKEFEIAYANYEKKVKNGEIKTYRSIKAVDLWRKMLGMLFETGHPWVTFKDPCNVRYTNQHMGVVHSSNLCTEITLHTNEEEIAVCNLGSVNLATHVVEDKGLDKIKLEKTIKTAMRMLDNVIEYNYYSVPQARTSNLRHRPVGLGIMGFQDALYKMHMAYASTEAVEFADQTMETVSYLTIEASSDLAKERGKYSSYDGSLWSKGILPIDSMRKMREERGNYYQVDDSETLDWSRLREKVKKDGIRNSNTMAIAPTATISNICGISQSIEPTYQNLFVKSNLSGEFTVVNPYLVNELKKRDLWDEVMVNDLKYYDGSVQPIDRVPEDLKQIYATAFEIDARWLVEAASRRQKWIDQAQSLNLYMSEPSGKKLDNLYKLAWVRGLKTTYYLRSIGATHMEKSTTESSNQQSKNDSKNTAPQACSILDPECEACQ